MRNGGESVLAAVVFVAADAADGEPGTLDISHRAAAADASLEGERTVGHAAHSATNAVASQPKR